VGRVDDDEPRSIRDFFGHLRPVNGVIRRGPG
jgi:hypothetical protein